MKPIIALSSRDGMMYQTDAYYIQQSYMSAIEKAGGKYIGVTPNSEHDYEYIAEMCDGLLICGGGDIDSKYYHEELHEKADLVKENVDIMDFKLIEVFLKHKKPVFGICRGMQILNVYYGGSLIQDIPSQTETKINHRQSEARCVGTHTISLNEDSFLGKKGMKDIYVNTFHHQVVKDLGKSLKVVAYSEDGFIEAIQNDEVVGVQWHPECMIDDPFHMNIIQNFVDKCKRSK